MCVGYVEETRSDDIKERTFIQFHAQNFCVQIPNLLLVAASRTDIHFVIRVFLARHLTSTSEYEVLYSNLARINATTKATIQSQLLPAAVPISPQRM